MTRVVVLLGAVGGSWLCIGRRIRRRRLNAALHELRRPLQGLALAAASADGGLERDLAVRGCLQAAAEAAEQLDRAVNGGRRRARSRLALDSLLAEAERRWGFCGRLEIADVPAGALRGDRSRLAAALDNLIANALEHGEGGVRLIATAVGDKMTIQVRNRRSAAGGSSGRDPRRGHGLRLARRIAAEHGGRLLPLRGEGGDVLAELELPSIPPAAS